MHDIKKVVVKVCVRPFYPILILSIFHKKENIALYVNSALLQPEGDLQNQLSV